jgi:hypothetical protein
MLHAGLVKQFVIKQWQKYASAISWRKANCSCQAIHKFDLQHSLPNGPNLHYIPFHDIRPLSSRVVLVLASALTGTNSSLPAILPDATQPNQAPIGLLYAAWNHC